MSNKENVSVNTGGISFAGLLTVLFIGLKLTNYINWSWWWVLSPLWIPLVIVLGIFAVMFIVLCIMYIRNNS